MPTLYPKNLLHLDYSMVDDATLYKMQLKYDLMPFEHCFTGTKGAPEHIFNLEKITDQRDAWRYINRTIFYQQRGTNTYYSKINARRKNWCRIHLNVKEIVYNSEDAPYVHHPLRMEISLPKEEMLDNYMRVYELKYSQGLL